MSGMMKPRLALDLDDIERKLRQAEQAVAPKSDPLAELARIVGQDDPFQSLLGDKQHGRVEPTFAAPQPAPDPRGRAAPLRAVPAPPQAFEPEPDAYASTDFSHIVEEAAAYDHADQQPTYAEAAPRRSRKGLIAVAAVLGAGAIGLTGTLMMRSQSSVRVSGEPPVVKADVAPVKVAPQTPGGAEIPNINKQLYEKGPQDTQTRVVSREEQPIDVRQAARDAAPAASPSPGPTSLSSALGEPRRVRTVSIKPDGTVIPPESAPAPRAAQNVTVASPPPVPPVAVRPAPAATPTTMPSTTASAAPAPAAPARLDPRTTSTPQPRPAEPVRQAAASPAPPAAVPAGTTPVATPAPKPQARVAAVAPPDAADTPKPTAPRAAEGGGGYSVQLGVRTSEEDARAAFRQMQQKYTELGGRSPSVQQAESNGKTIFRVRVSGMAKDDATALCERLKSSGGQCFVAKN
jgi:hypothetical protein